MALSKLAKHRIGILIRFMETLPKSANKHFDMASYVEGQDRFISQISKRDLMVCGTTACALGWASTAPSFKKAGLSMDGAGNCSLRGTDVKWNDEIAVRFFDITPDQEDMLFGGYHSDASPKKWAHRVRKLMRKWATAENR